MTRKGVRKEIVGRGARTRAALMEAGEKLFASHPVHSVSIDDIAQAAEVAKGSFYTYFPDRDELCRAIAEQVRVAIETAVADANAGIGDPAERIVRTIFIFVRGALRNPERSRVLRQLFAGAALTDAPLSDIIRADVRAGLSAQRFHGVEAETGLLLTMGVAHVAASRMLEAKAPASPNRLSSDLGVALLRGLVVTDKDARLIAARAAKAIYASR